LRHVVTEIANLVPDGSASPERLAELRGYGCETRINVVRLLAPSLDYEDHSKDIDFSPSGIQQRREAGYRHTLEALALAPWRKEIDPLDGLVLHEIRGGEMARTSSGAASSMALAGRDARPAAKEGRR
jgi:NTE family protein